MKASLRVPLPLVALSAILLRLGFTAALSTPSPLTAAIVTGATAESISHRIFVGDLSPLGCDVGTLSDEFQKYGSVSEVTLHGLWERSVDNDPTKASKGSKVRPYAFVKFDQAESATRAVAGFENRSADVPVEGSGLFGVVRTAYLSKPRPKSNSRRDRAEQRAALISRLAEGSNVVLQAPKSHMERLVSYISAREGGTGSTCDIVGELDPGRRTIGLLFLHASDPSGFASELLNVPYASTAVNKLYIVNGGAVFGSPTAGVAEEALQRLKELVASNKDIGNELHKSDVAVRVQAFPPKMRSDLIAGMDAKWDDPELAGAEMSPTSFTHTLSVVELEKAEGGEDGTYIMGLSDAMPTDAVSTRDRSRFHSEAIETGAKDDVCRAYYKLQEALTRYANGNVSTNKSLAGSVALDCGASPGGWTKYLMEEAGCKTTHSIDPGELDPSVLGLDGVRHWMMKVEDALPQLVEEGVRIDVWTSDMCLHDMSNQIDWLLRAKDAGVLSPNAMFVLTLKCNVGHSKSAFDNQVQPEVERLQGIATGIETIHLFSNRSGERTVMGFLT